MRINYEFADLECFLKVAEFSSFQMAAERMNVSQSAITRRIQKLEAALDVTLFERTTRAVKITLAGKRLQTRAQAMTDDAIETTLALRDESVRYEYQRNAIVTVAVIPSAIPNILPEAIMGFRAAGYAARIRILDRLAHDVTEAVSGGDADFGIGSIFLLEPNMSFEPLIHDRIVLAMRKEDPLADSAEVRWEQLVVRDFIVPIKGTGNRLLIDEAIARAHQSLSWSYEVRRTSTALELINAGVGVAALPLAAISSTAYSEIVARPLVSPSVSRSIGIVCRVGQQLSGPAAAFLVQVRQAILARQKN